MDEAFRVRSSTFSFGGFRFRAASSGFKVLRVWATEGSKVWGLRVWEFKVSSTRLRAIGVPK